MGRRPASRRGSMNVKHEALLWRSVMAELYGEECRELISTPSQHRGASGTPPELVATSDTQLVVPRMTPSASTSGIRSPVASLADVAAGHVVLKAARLHTDDNVSAFSGGSWRGVSDQDLWQMVKAPFDAEVDDIRQYERR